MNTLKRTIMERDGLSSAEANELIEEAREVLNERIAEGDFGAAEDVMMEYFGLEMDYIFDLM